MSSSYYAELAARAIQNGPTNGDEPPAESASPQPPTYSRLFRWRQAIVETDLGPSVKLVALVLSQHMNAEGGSCFPGGTRLHNETGLHISTVWRAVAELRKRGWLDVESGGGNKPNHYEARFAPIASGDGSHDETAPIAPGDGRGRTRRRQGSRGAIRERQLDRPLEQQQQDDNQNRHPIDEEIEELLEAGVLVEVDT